MVYVPHYLFFYIVGRAHWIDVKPNNKLWMIIVLFVVDILLEHSLPYGVGMSASFYEYALSYIVALLGIYITINISCKFSSSDYPFVRKCKSILVFYGFNSIVVLGLHTVFVRSIKCIFSSVGIVSIWSFPVRQIILWLLLALAIISINKWVPWAIGKNNDTRSKKY